MEHPDTLYGSDHTGNIGVFRRWIHYASFRTAARADVRTLAVDRCEIDPLLALQQGAAHD